MPSTDDQLSPDVPPFDLETPTHGGQRPNGEATWLSKPLELVPCLIIACRVALIVSVIVFTNRAVDLLLNPGSPRQGRMQVDIMVYAYTLFVFAWLMVEAVGEIYRCRKALTKEMNSRDNGQR